jgi:RsiW-degrading membrane proteinase PrsW (M82 family)
MKIKRAIVIGIAIWSIGILLYSISYYVRILENAETQANLVLFVAVMPLVWLGCAFYYKKDKQTHGYLVGQTMLLTAVVLDALITVPFYVIPKGGSHYNFFTALGFWIIAFEFLLVAVLYWYARVYPQRKPSKK